MDPANVMENLWKELDGALKAMSKAKTAEEKVVHSQIIKNLSESLGVFLNFVDAAMDDDLAEED